MKLKDLEIYVENSLRNVKAGKWDIEKGKTFIFLKLNDYIGNMVDKIDSVLGKEIKEDDPF